MSKKPAHRLPTPRDPEDSRPPTWTIVTRLKSGIEVTHRYGPMTLQLKNLKEILLALAPEQAEAVGVALLAFEQDIEEARAKERYAPPVLEAIREAQRLFPA